MGQLTDELVDVGIVNLQDQVLDLGVAADLERHVLGQDELGCVQGPREHNARRTLAHRTAHIHPLAARTLGHLATIPE